MDSQHYVFILFSATPYRMGRWIRFCTREPYNHVAISLEEDLKEMYAFARRFYRTPFYGGFVTEHPYRYHYNGTTADIRLYRIPVTEEQLQMLQHRLSTMGSHPYRYLYNHLSVLTAPIHKKVSVRDAYTCAEFVVSVLSSLGLAFDINRFYTIGGIAEQLAQYHIYTGEFPTSADEDSLFFDPHPVRHPLYASTRDLLRLLWRKAVV